MIVLLTLLVGAVSLFYFYFIRNLSFFKNKGIPTNKLLPVFGDFLNVTTGREHFGHFMQRVYNLKGAENLRYVGTFQFTTPLLFLRSPELIKQICVKDFDHFLNHRSFSPEGAQDLLSKNLFALKGQNWRNMRSTLSPSFTSSKMKAMFVLICQNAEAFTKHFLDKNEDVLEVELKDAFTRYTNDVIASVAFGIQVDSLKDKTNDFYLMGKEASNFTTTIKKLKIFFYQMFPSLFTFLGLRVIDDQVTDFFMQLIKDAIKMREEQNIKRPDLLGLLIEARKGQVKTNVEDEVLDNSFAAVEEHLQTKNLQTELTDFDIVSQAFLFFVAGFETVATTMCFAAYEIATNPDVQRRLIEEIELSCPKDVTPSYETIMNSTYLDMVISESLRKWPIAVGTDRVVTKPYTIEPVLPEEQPLHLNLNDVVMVPIFALHYDPKYYPNPEKFDPERFSPENRKNIDPYTYLPFGVGPRNCIGSRFALLETKCIIFYLLRHFEIVPVEKTAIPLKLNNANFNLGTSDGFTLGLKRRL